MSTHFLNGQLVSEEQLLISPRDLGFTRGYAVFDFLRTYNQKPFRLSDHLDRLIKSAELIELQIPWSKTQLQEWVQKTLAANQWPEEKFIKIMLSGGVSHSMAPEADPTVMVLVDPATIYPADFYEKGVAVITVEHARYHPEAKSNNYIEGVKQVQRAKEQGAQEPIYYSNKQVFEGSNSNVFAVIKGELLTPADRVLGGITRQVLLEILKLDIPVKVKNFTYAELLEADEVFITGSAKEIVPVTIIDGRPVSDGQVGPITKEVIQQFHDYTWSNGKTT